MESSNFLGINKIKNIESTKIFVILVYILLFTHSIYEYIFLKESFSLKLKIFEGIFLFLFFVGLCLIIYLLQINSKKFFMYIYIILCVGYPIIHDILIINTFNKYVSTIYLDFFIIIIAPLLLSTIFLILISLSIISRYCILFYFFQVHYLPELMFTLSVSIVTSFLILFTLKTLVKEIQLKFEKRVTETMLLIMEILEVKDPYTKGHSQRVAAFALILAKETNQYDEEDLIKFQFACLVHDIGKIGIPDEILKKTSQLTNEEYTIIKNHPNLGLKILKNLTLIEGFEAIIYSHHERWDGYGYPNGLKNNEIPFSARIVAIADAFDAMTSTRSYRPALSSEEAYRRIITGAGSQFDPDLVKEFKKVYPLWIKYVQA